MVLPRPPFKKICAWCETPFLAMHSKHKCCSPSCRDKHAIRRDRKWWRGFYRKNHERLSAYYSAYHAANRETRNARSRENARRRKASMSEADRERAREHRHKRDATRRLIRKITWHWRCSAAEARSMIKSGSFPP